MWWCVVCVGGVWCCVVWWCVVVCGVVMKMVCSGVWCGGEGWWFCSRV